MQPCTAPPHPTTAPSNQTTPPIHPTGTGNLKTVLLAILVPACAVLLLLLVGAVIAVVYGRRRRRTRKIKKRTVAVRPMGRAKISSTNRDETGAGLVDKYIVQLKRCIYSVEIFLWDR